MNMPVIHASSIQTWTSRLQIRLFTYIFRLIVAVFSSNGFWQVPSPAWSFNGKQRSRKNNTAIIDTGTTLCLVADEIVEEIYGSI